MLKVQSKTLELRQICRGGSLRKKKKYTHKTVLCAHKSSVNEWIRVFFPSPVPAVLVISELTLFFIVHSVFLNASHNGNHRISNSLWSKGVCRCVNWLFAYDTWFLFLLIIILVCFLLTITYTHFSHWARLRDAFFRFSFARSAARLYCYAFGLIYPCVLFFFFVYGCDCNTWPKCNAFDICVCVGLLLVMFYFFLLVSTKRDDKKSERVRDCFPFRPSLPFAFWRKPKRSGCAHITHSMEWETKFQLFALRAPWRQNSFYVQLNKHTVIQHHAWPKNIQICATSRWLRCMYACYMRTWKCNTYFSLG